LLALQIQSPSPKVCRHCSQRRPRHGGRGLCWSCHANLNIRRLYGPVSPRGNKAATNDEKLHRPLPVPTVAEPGSEEKIRVLCQRVENGELLKHPDDRELKHRSAITVFAFALPPGVSCADENED
jgi:hypothetical protein